MESIYYEEEWNCNIPIDSILEVFFFVDIFITPKRRENMDPINSGTGTLPQIYAMKKAMEVQGREVMKALESISPSSSQPSGISGAGITGLGQTLDIKA
jgi:hypothetical protein